MQVQAFDAVGLRLYRDSCGVSIPRLMFAWFPGVTVIS